MEGVVFEVAWRWRQAAKRDTRETGTPPADVQRRSCRTYNYRMPLTEAERSVLKAVVRSYCVDREPTRHVDLLRLFNDPRPITKVIDERLLVQGNVGPDPIYLPTILAFHRCGELDLLQRAMDAVGVVVRDLTVLFKKTYDRGKRYSLSEGLSAIEAANYRPVGEQFELGLFLAKEIPGVVSVQVDERGRVASFVINEHILTQDPDAIWIEYVKKYDAAVEASIGQGARQAVAEPQPPAERKRSEWPPPPWKIQESLGEGGQGWTYKVRRSGDSSGALYVLKRLKNKERLARFNAEVAALTKLNHPGILKIVATNEETDRPFFVSEYCDGHDLGKADLSKRDILTKLQIFRQVCDAIVAAHGDGSVVVGDFGLCIDLNELRERATQTLEGIGAERYIAPEVAKGRVAEPQATSDLYSLGKVLYFILSGNTLMREEYAEGEDDLRKKDTSPAMHFVYELFDRTIRERPEERFQSAADLLYAVDAVIERVQLKAHVLKPSSRQHCIFCVTGEYNASSGVGGDELIYYCSNCGNMQRFHAAPGRRWWEKK